MRQHGLQAPLDPHQVASWIVFFALVSGVYAFYMPFVEDAGVRWFLVALYSLLVAAIVTLDLYTSYIDPSDPGVKGAMDGEFFCGLCQASVARSSKHCRACDRCVEGFDHHCKWLNNCVGARNYWHFFALVSSTVSLLILQLAWGLWLFIRSFSDKDEMKERVADKYGKSVVYGGWQAALGIYMVLLLTAVVMLGELLFFHMVLISKGLTTYDYIVAQRDAKLAAPPIRSGSSSGLKACRSSRVADTATARRRVKVGLNPCAAMKTSKPKGSPASWGAGKGKSLPGGPAALSVTTTSGLKEGKPGLEGAGSGSLGAKDGLGISDKAAAAGSVQAMVARAVAEQTVATQPSLREVAQLRGSHAAGAGPAGGAGSLGSPGCVPECSTTASGGGAGAVPDFTPLVQPPSSGMPVYGQGVAGSPPGTSGQCYHQHHQHQQQRQLTGSPGTQGAGVGMRMAAGSGSGIGPTSGAGPASPTGFDAAMPAGRHLGGHSASPSSQPSGGIGSLPTTPTPLSRPNSLPPLRVPLALPQPTMAGPGPRSLLLPPKSPSGMELPTRQEAPAAPE